MRRWEVETAKARFSEFLEASLKEGPQVVSCRGVEIAVLVPLEQWQRLQVAGRPILKDLLLAPQPRTDAYRPGQRHWRHRRSPDLER
jgi:prevent-host-death family protein